MSFGVTNFQYKNGGKIYLHFVDKTYKNFLKKLNPQNLSFINININYIKVDFTNCLLSKWPSVNTASRTML